MDPFDGGGQFCDRGDSYRPVIFTADAAQSQDAESSAAAAAQDLGRPRSAIKVELRGSVPFWPAEVYHQKYAELNDLKYSVYRFSCGPDRPLDAVWGSQARTGESWQKVAELE